MSLDAPPPTTEARLRTMQIIAGAIALGAVMALAVLSFVRSQNPPPPRDPPLVSYILLGAAVLEVGAALLVPGQLAAAGRRRLAASGAGQDAGAWYGLYQTLLIIRLALLEAPALALAVAWLLEGWPVTLVAAAACIVLMLLQFPSALRVECWVEAQKELVSQELPPS
jgi:hypothetical protein